MSYKQDQFTSDFALMNGAHVIDVDAQDEHAIMTDNEEDVQSYNHFGTTSSYPEAQFTPSEAQPFQQQQEQQEEYYDRDQDADSEMQDGDDEELLDYDEDSDLDEEDEIDEDEDAESFDEEDEDEDEDVEEGSDDGSDEGGGAADPGANGKPGATEDDAIELSD